MQATDKRHPLTTTADPRSIAICAGLPGGAIDERSLGAARLKPAAEDAVGHEHAFPDTTFWIFLVTEIRVASDEARPTIRKYRADGLRPSACLG